MAIDDLFGLSFEQKKVLKDPAYNIADEPVVTRPSETAGARRPERNVGNFLTDLLGATTPGRAFRQARQEREIQSILEQSDFAKNPQKALQSLTEAGYGQYAMALDRQRQADALDRAKTGAEIGKTLADTTDTTATASQKYRGLVGSILAAALKRGTPEAMDAAIAQGNRIGQGLGIDFGIPSNYDQAFVENLSMDPEDLGKIGVDRDRNTETNRHNVVTEGRQAAAENRQERKAQADVILAGARLPGRQAPVQEARANAGREATNARAVQAEAGRNERANRATVDRAVAQTIKANPGATVRKNYKTRQVQYSMDGGRTWKSAL